MRNLGKKSLEEVVKKLEDLGLGLKMQEAVRLRLDEYGFFRHILNEVHKQLDVVVHNLCGERSNLLSGGRAVGSDFKRELIKIYTLLDAGAASSVVLSTRIA